METTRRASRRAMLIPKSTAQRRFIPAVGPHELPFLLSPITTSERKALEQISVTADLLMVGDKPWLLMPADRRLLDTLAMFGADAADRENDLEDEADEGEEDDRDSDNAMDPRDAQGCFTEDREPDDLEARKHFIVARQSPDMTVAGTEWSPDGQFWRPIYAPGYDGSHDRDELRKAKAFVARAS